MNVTFRQFRYFDALARQGHFGRAADLCAISQPALSMQIRELEEALGAALVERRARQIRLTRFGEEILPRVREILRAVEDLGELAPAGRGRIAGRLRLGVIPTIAPYLLPRLIRDLTRETETLEINVRETVTPRLISELEEGRLDAAILALPVSEPGLEEVALFSEEFVLVRPEAEAGAPVPSPTDLQKMRLLLLEEGHCFRDQALSFCKLRPSPPREIMDASSLSTLVQMVGAGIGVTLIPEMAVPVETRSAPVAIAHFGKAAPRRVIGMIWRSSNPISEQLLALSERVRASATGSAGDGRAAP